MAAVAEARRTRREILRAAVPTMIELYLGTAELPGISFEEIGRLYGCTGSRISQLLRGKVIVRPRGGGIPGHVRAARLAAAVMRDQPPAVDLPRPFLSRRELERRREERRLAHESDPAVLAFRAEKERRLGRARPELEEAKRELLALEEKGSAQTKRRRARGAAAGLESRRRAHAAAP